MACDVELTNIQDDPQNLQGFKVEEKSNRLNHHHWCGIYGQI
jgi:hypothetical protein